MKTQNSKILLCTAMLVLAVVLIGYFAGWPAVGLALFGFFILFVIAVQLWLPRKNTVRATK